MALVLQSPLMARERILTMGGPGTGKSSALLTIARKCPHVQFYILEVNDVTYERLLDTTFTDVRANGNVNIQKCWDWEQLLSTFTHVCRNMQRDDWVDVDLGGDAWKMVQSWFAEQVHGVDMAEYALQSRQRAQQANAAVTNAKDLQKTLELLDGWMDWSVINPVYLKFVKAMLMAEGHVWLTAGEEKYTAGSGDAATEQLLGGLGYKPSGQKHLPHQFHTVLRMSKAKVAGSSQWQLTTVKDRGRPEVDRMVWNDFATDYLMRVAGWGLVAV